MPCANASKIKDLDELAGLVRGLKAEGKKVVMSHGVFDLLHMGHIRHLEQARQMGDVLVVTLTQDRYVNKGPDRPAFPEDLRAEALAALSAVDFVAVNRWPQATETIRLLQPNIYVKGQDYRIAEQDITGGISVEAEAVQSVGGEIRFTDDITFSSSTLLNKFFSPFPPETDEYLQSFRKRHSSDEVLSWLDRAAQVRPLVVGEAIIDEYLFCDGIGKSSKDPVLAVLQKRVESYVGGSLAVANHLAGLCPEVALVTQLGDADRSEDWVRRELHPNVSPLFVTKSGSPTLRKRRVLEAYSGSKLLEIYLMNDQPTEGADEQKLQAALLKTIDVDQHDLVLVADYGHGMLSPRAIATLCGMAAFLALNVQSNAGNRGFNPISKYSRADYICLNSHEVEVETRRHMNGDVQKTKAAMMEIAARTNCHRFTVTRGKFGSLHYDVHTGFHEAPALATRVLDRVGSGDGVLALTSLLVQMGAPWDIVAFLGNVAGAEMVAQLGNRTTIDKVAMSKHVVTLLK